MQDIKYIKIWLDSLDIIDKLSDEQTGKLFRAIRDYHQGKIIELDPITDIVFFPLKQQFDRNIESYKAICERNKVNGEAGGRPKIETEKTQNNPVGSSGGQNNPKNKIKNKTKTKNNIEDNIDARKLAFQNDLSKYLDEYGRDMLNSFFMYWTELNQSKTKMRFELEKTWETNLRLIKWKKNNFVAPPQISGKWKDTSNRRNL